MQKIVLRLDLCEIDKNIIFFDPVWILVMFLLKILDYPDEGGVRREIAPIFLKIY